MHNFFTFSYVFVRLIRGQNCCAGLDRRNSLIMKIPSLSIGGASVIIVTCFVISSTASTETTIGKALASTTEDYNEISIDNATQNLTGEL